MFYSIIYLFNHFGGLVLSFGKLLPMLPNFLSGAIPPQLGDLDVLQVLRLRYNNFEGKFSRCPLRYCRTSLFLCVSNFRGLGESVLAKCRVRINSAAYTFYLLLHALDTFTLYAAHIRTVVFSSMNWTPASAITIHIVRTYVFSTFFFVVNILV